LDYADHVIWVIFSLFTHCSTNADSPQINAAGFFTMASVSEDSPTIYSKSPSQVDYLKEEGVKLKPPEGD
jgi:hypothetical protein